MVHVGLTYKGCTDAHMYVSRSLYIYKYIGLTLRVHVCEWDSQGSLQHKG